MTSSRPYLLRAIYDWLIDNRLTPYVMVDALYPDVMVPEQFVDNGKIVLNVAPQAVAGLMMNNDAVEFDARFSGIAHHLHIPVMAIKAIYAVENGRGMVFSEDDEDGDDVHPPESPNPPRRKGKPTLKVVK